MSLLKLSKACVVIALAAAGAAQESVSASATPSQTPVPATPGRPSFVGGSSNSSKQVTVTAENDDQKPDLEWTALGDSYAAGVGSTKYVDGQRCLRYDEAYPIVINWNPEYPPGGEVLPPGYHKLNNVVCSGAEAQDIIDWQLLDEPTYWQPSIQYGNRPAFGSPEFATLTAGGDDIDFPGILFNCILGAHVPGGPTQRSCTEQRAHTWGLLNDGDYIGELTRVIEAIVTKGQAQEGEKGENFKLYVTGYGRFFNAETTGDETNCDSTTFNIDGLWNGRAIGSNGASDTKLTTDLRKDFNDMADMLNNGVQQAVDDYNNAHDSDDPRVVFVDIQTDQAGQDILRGHRFCEPGVQEPDPSNDQLYFFHYPYSSTDSVDDSPAQTIFETAWNQTFEEAEGNITETYPNFNHFMNAVFENMTPDLFYASGSDDYADPAVWGGIGGRTRVFHPSFLWHDTIAKLVLTQYLLDHQEADGSTDDGSDDDSSDGTLDPVNVDLGVLTCNVPHDEGDDEYYVALDTAEQAIADFCSATHSAGIDFASTESVETGGIVVRAVKDDDFNGCPALDVTSDGFVDVCTERLSIPLHNCDTVKGDSDLWKQGGTFYRDCVTWSWGLQ